MGQEKWIPLHVHTEYSAYDGAIRIDGYLKYALEHGLPAAAVSDHFTMSAYPEFDKKFAAAGIKRIFGNELYAGTMFGDGRPRLLQGKRRRFHLNAFATSPRGLLNLQRLAAAGIRASEDSAKGPYFVTREAVEEHHQDVAFATACVAGELPCLLAAGLESEADEWYRQMASLVGAENLYIEILDTSYAEQEAVNAKLLDFARARGARTIITTDSHYLPQDKSWYNYLLAAQKKKQESRDGELNPQQEVYDVTGVMDLSLRAPEQIAEKWASVCPEGVAETYRFAERCEEFRAGGCGGYQMPRQNACTPEEFAAEAARGLERRMDEYGVEPSRRQEYVERLRRETAVVTEMGFIEYFVFVSRLIGGCREAGIYVGPGRGSAAGSVLTWSLGITGLDPIKYGLVFERFLNRERVTMPDIDIDFEDARRGEVIEKLKKDYGSENVVAITNYSRSKWKMSIRDVMRVKNYQPWQSDEFVKLLEDKIDTGYDAESDDEESEAVRSVGVEDLAAVVKSKPRALENLQIKQEDALEILRISGNFNGLIRNYGKHASGIVICPGPACDYLPLGRVNGVVASQYDMGGVDYRKLVKVDILGLSTLTMIKEMVQSAARISPEGGAPDINQFLTYINKWGSEPAEKLGDYEAQMKAACPALTPESIQAAFKLFQTGQTTGVFQFASPGMRRLLGEIKPATMEDLSSAVALFRPGPLKSGIAAHFVRGCRARRGEPCRAGAAPAGESPIDKLPEKAAKVLREVAKDSHGEMIYQEHIMAAARKIAGYSLGEADILRKAMGKKDKALMAEERKKFVGKASERGWDADEASAVFDAIEYFAGYGFNKAHSACYAALAVISAWYAANRAPAFWAALINDTAKKSKTDAAGHIALSPVIREARRYARVSAPRLPSGGDCLSAASIEGIMQARCEFRRAADGAVPDWGDPDDYTIFLGLSSIKGAGKNIGTLSKLAALGVADADTVESLFKKAVACGTEGAMAAAAHYYRAGFFDRLLLNTLREHCAGACLPVYMRLAILEMGGPRGAAPEVREAMRGAFAALSGAAKKKKEEGNYPFAIVKSRCVWGSFLAECAARVLKKTKYKNKPWTEENVDGWIKDYLTPAVRALVLRALEIEREMLSSPAKRLEAYLNIYRLEKEAYGETFTAPDWAVASEAVAFSAAVYPDQFPALKREIADMLRKKLPETEFMRRLLDPKRGLWVLGQFDAAGWKGEAKGGFIRLNGRYGARDRALYVTLDAKLPLVSVENARKAAGLGGIVALRVWFGKNGRDQYPGVNLVKARGGLPESFSGGFDFGPYSGSIAILPLASAEAIREPYMLPYDGIRLASVPEYRHGRAGAPTEKAFRRLEEQVWRAGGDCLPLLIVREDSRAGAGRSRWSETRTERPRAAV